VPGRKFKKKQNIFVFMVFLFFTLFCYLPIG
jgi:hypothetical protein